MTTLIYIVAAIWAVAVVLVWVVGIVQAIEDIRAGFYQPKEDDE